MSLLNVDTALDRILSQVNPLNTEIISLQDALHRVLAIDIYSDVNLPPFANSSMDGYALRSEDVISASKDHPVSLQVVSDIPAGVSPDRVIDKGESARIMTGAPLPDGADAVIPVEDTDADWRNDTLSERINVYRAVASGDYIRPAGEDIERGELVLPQGTRIRPQELGILAALGHAQVTVSKQPRVAILSSGDELIRADEPLSPGKIRDVNSYTLSGLVASYGGIPIALPVAKDSLEAVRQMFHDALVQQPDMIISSAGVSVGAADYIKDVLEELGEVNFWRINLRPGKPLVFGKLQNVLFFGLPGNPVSAIVTFEVLVRPALYKLMRCVDNRRATPVIIDEDIESDGRRSYLRVRLKYVDGQLHATTTGTQSSGALMSMVLADGLLIVPEGVEHVVAGTALDVYVLRE